MERGQFTFYRSFWEGVKMLSQRDRLAVLEAIIDYGLNGVERELTPRQAGFFVLVRPVLDTGRKRARVGKQGGSKAKANSKQRVSKKENEIEMEKELEKEIDTQTDIDKGNGPGGVCVDSFFADFWDKYPVQVGKAEALQVWQQVIGGEREAMQALAAISAWEKTPRWQNEGGRYIPYPAKFLREGYWKIAPAMHTTEKVPQGARGELGEVELENIRRLLRESEQLGNDPG